MTITIDRRRVLQVAALVFLFLAGFLAGAERTDEVEAWQQYGLVAMLLWISFVCWYLSRD